MHDSKAPRRWYQYRFALLLALFVTISSILGIFLSPLPSRVAEEFDPVPAGFVTFSWLARRNADGEDGPGFAIRTRWQSEKPFMVQVYRESTRSLSNDHDFRQPVCPPMWSRAQLVGHNAILDCELVFSRNCLTVIETTDGAGRVVGESRVLDAKNVRWKGIPVAYLPGTGWQRAGFWGTPGAFVAIECGQPTGPAGDNIERFIFSFEFDDY